MTEPRPPRPSGLVPNLQIVVRVSVGIVDPETPTLITTEMAFELRRVGLADAGPLDDTAVPWIPSRGLADGNPQVSSG